MARRSLFAVATIALSILGANAGPCRPSTTVTSAVETSSTVVSETLSPVASETLSTAVESSSTTLIETSSTTLAETSSTSQAPSCVETQVITNPGFDDDDGAPWSGVAGNLNTNGARSANNYLRLGFWNGGGDVYTFSQTLTNVQEGNYRFTYFSRLVSFSGWSSDSPFSCSIYTQLNGQLLPSGFLSESSSRDWTPSDAVWQSPVGGGTADEVEVVFTVQCSGEFNDLYIGFDDVTLERVCGPLQS